MPTIIYDNDAALDDMIALLYLLSDPNVNLAAITVPGTGEAHGLVGAKNIANLLHHLNMPNIPIAYCKDERPLENAGVQFPEWLRDEMDTVFNKMEISENPNPDIQKDVIKLMLEVILQSKENITILATGPLTNIAYFLVNFPELQDKIENIVIMGGALNVAGNINVFHEQPKGSQAELNIYADPVAAKIVFESGVKVTLVPLDATNQVPLTREFIDDLAKKQTPALRIMYRLLKDQIDLIGESVFYTQFFLWDPLAAMLCANPALGNAEQTHIAFDPANAVTKPVETAEESTATINVVTVINQPELILSKLIKQVEKNEQNFASVTSAGLFSQPSIRTASTAVKRTNFELK